MKNSVFVSLIYLLSLFSLPIYAAEKDEAIKMVESAVNFYKSNGESSAIEELKKEKSPFVKGDLYVFAYDMDCNMKAHPKNPKLIGKNLCSTPDADGKMFRREIIEKAKTDGSGWVDYKYKNPDTNKIENKTTYLKKEGNLIFCAGIYK